MKKTFFVLFFAILFTSCSLNYETNREDRVILPDLYFENLNISKIEGGNLKTKVFAHSLEQYNKSRMSFAEDVSFDLFTEDKEIQVQGKCGLISINPTDEVYTMFNGIEIKSYEQNLAVKAEALKWNNQTEQLSAPIEYNVTITNDIIVPENAVKSENDSSSKMTLVGKKFAASGVTRTYSFGKSLHGKVSIEDNIESEEDFSEENMNPENDDFDLDAAIEAFSNAGFSVEVDDEN